jgi:hypothetical protein
VSIASLVMGSMLSEAVSPNEEPDLYLKLAFTATLFAGLFQASLGLLRYYIFAHPQLFSSFIIIYIYIFFCVKMIATLSNKFSETKIQWLLFILDKNEFKICFYFHIRNSGRKRSIFQKNC